MALNPLLNHARSTSTSSSHSASSAANNLYDLGYNPAAAAAYNLSRVPGNVHHRTTSQTSSFATHLTSPADSPPDLALGSLAGSNNLPGGGHFNPLGNSHQSAFKSSSLSALSRRSRAGSSPYARTADEYPAGAGFSSASSRSSSCSEASEQDDLAAMYFNAAANTNTHPSAPSHHALGPMQGHGQQADYSGLFVTPPPSQPQQSYSIHPHQLGGVSQHYDPSPIGGNSAFGAGVNVPPEAHLEQLAANVRSSTTTTASDRAKQVFVQAWLGANYAPYPDGNVPRQGLYNSYRRVCDSYNIPHINTATLGKAIRLCFPAIKTRRLGVRGNSKYHYCGIRPATVAEAEFLQDFVRRTTNHQAIAASSRRGAAAVAAHAASMGHGMGGNGSDEEDDEDSEASSSVGHGGYGDHKDSYGSSFGGYSHSSASANNAPPPLNSVPHPLTLGGGLKSPTLFTMMGADDKTPTTNSLLSAAQAQSIPGNRSVSSNGPNGASGLTYGVGHAQIRGRRGLGSTESASVGSRPGTGSGAPGGFGGIQPAPVSTSVKNLSNFPSIDEALGIDSSNLNGESREGGSPGSSSGNTTSPQHLAAIEVWKWFEDHLDGLLESVRGWRFDQFELHIRTFWASLSGDYREVVHAPAVAGLVVRADAVVYDEILEMLRSQMLSPIPPHALASLRQLAEKMEKILLLSLEGYGNTFVEPKVELGARFGHLVLRFLDMFQVTQALTSVLSNAQQLADMRRSWSEVDFESVRNQSALVCNCRHEDLVQLLEVDFVQVLDNLVANATMGMTSGAEPVREIMNWADLCCERLMGGNVSGNNAPGEERSTMSSRSVLIRWGYVTSQIMRDLTIRSDPAFGAFQILKLFLDDWIALNVLRSVALSTNSVQASVEPVMQQQYLALSPMPGQEFTGAGGPSNATSSSIIPQNANHHPSITAQLMDHTPTTSSMLAALQDSYSNGQQSSQGPHPLSNTSSYDSASFYPGAQGDQYGEYGSSFDMSFLNGSHHDTGSTNEGHSPAAGSVGSSASMAELAAGVAAAAVRGGSEAGDPSPLLRRNSDESNGSAEVKAEGN